VGNALIVSVPTRQDLQGFIFPLQLDKMENFKKYTIVFNIEKPHITRVEDYVQYLVSFTI
jgi:hypothetical protein